MDRINQVFYVWVSVFSLLNISVFWSFMADTYSKQQAKRLFGFIASGSSLGAIFGPTISLLFAGQVGSDTLVLVSAVMLLIPMIIAIYLSKIKETDLENTASAEYNESPMSGNFLDGFVEFLRTPLSKNILFGIGMFIVLYSGMSTFVYLRLRTFLPILIKTRELKSGQESIWRQISLLSSQQCLAPVVWLNVTGCR